jgi:septum site-determining protein MinD
MSKCISIHSSRGGTGKTMLATNLAILYAQQGKNVALLDLDFRAPSLFGVFSKALKSPIDCYINTYFDGRCPAEAALVNVSDEYGLKGKLLIGFSNPDVIVIRSMAEKSQAWETSAMKKLFSLRSKLFSKMGIDYCIYDTSPGVQYTSVNAAVSSDLTIVVTTLDSLDMQGTQNMLSDLYDAFERKTVILLNKVFPEIHTLSNKNKTDMIGLVEKSLNRSVIGAIPCYCGVLQTERSKIMAIEDPTHPFIKNLDEIKIKLDKSI